jgi:uncharacterized iron-regulated membrane protein
MAVFLIIEGLTGSLIAFYGDLDRLISPQFFATPLAGCGAPRSRRARRVYRKIGPAWGRVQVVNIDNQGRAGATVHPRQDPVTGKPYDLGFNRLYLNSWTGDELGRSSSRDFSWGWASVMPFIVKLHEDLALGMTGTWALFIVALVWMLDCFVGFYLTLPVAIENFLHRRKPTWLLKLPAGFFRVNFDLHRASGLWLWPMLFIFAWSSAMFTSPPAFCISGWVMHALFDFAPQDEEATPMLPPPKETPRLDWRSAETWTCPAKEESHPLWKIAEVAMSGKNKGVSRMSSNGKPCG